MILSTFVLFCTSFYNKKEEENKIKVWNDEQEKKGDQNGWWSNIIKEDHINEKKKRESSKIEKNCIQILVQEENNV